VVSVGAPGGDDQVAPCSASATAVAAPMPDDAPVTSATLPLSKSTIVFILRFWVLSLDALRAKLADGGTKVLSVALDVTDEDAWRAVADTVAEFGGLDILVNNAGVMLLGPVEGADPTGPGCSTRICWA
jgi:NAD(P)-dependent dehydrogenase (short-subunit alcohol dehydrogenase family)